MATRNSSAVWLEKYHRWQTKATNDFGVRRTFTDPVPGRKGQTACNRKADEWVQNSTRDPNMRCSIALEQWLGDLKLTSKRVNLNGKEVCSDHYCKCRNITDNWILPVIAPMKLSAISLVELQRIINRAYMKGLSKKTLQNIRGTLSAWLRYCRLRNLTTLSTSEIAIPRDAMVGEKNILQPNDMSKLFSSNKTVMYGCETDEWYVNAWRLAVVLGYRPGELVALEDKHLSGGVLRVRGAVNSRNIRTSGKNDNAIRDTVLPPIAISILSDQATMLKRAGIISQYIFPFKDGSCSKQRVMAAHWDKYRAHNGIGHITPYEMRHTYVSVCSGRSDITLAELKALVGHSKNMDTLGVYSHKISDADQRVAQQVNAAFADVIAGK